VTLIYNVSMGVIAPTVPDKAVAVFVVAFAIAFVVYLVWLIRMPHERREQVMRNWPEGE
jgi:phage shock protein PspC (stress-responsive transcriptional regulator)